MHPFIFKWQVLAKIHHPPPPQEKRVRKRGVLSVTRIPLRVRPWTVAFYQKPERELTMPLRKSKSKWSIHKHVVPDMSEEELRQSGR